MSHDRNDSGSEPPASKPPPRKKAWKLPPFLNHFNVHDAKVVFRCWAAVWISTLLIFIQPTLDNLGLATFFATLVLFIVPPASMLFAYLLAALSLLFGMCLAWAWGLVTMKAALSVRPQADLEPRLQALGKAAAEQAQQNGESVEWQTQVLIHDGFTLDARVTAVYYVMGCLFIYFLARLRFSNHKFVPLQLFGTIVTDIFILIGPTLPQFMGNLGSVLVKPGAVGIGIGMACSLVFFPHSTSYAVLDKVEKVVLLCEQSLSATRRRLKDDSVSVAELAAAKASHLGLYKATEPLLAFLPLDLSRGRWNAEDVQGLQAPVREAMMASLTLLDFHISRINVMKREDYLEKHHAGAGSETPNGIGLHQMDESADLIHALQTPENGEVLAKTREAILETTTDLLQSCSASIKLSAKCINTVNTRRWINQPKQAEFDDLARQLDEQITSLCTTRETCISNTTEKVLASHADLFDENGELKPSSKRGPRLLRGIIVSMVIEERMLGVALSLEKLQQAILHLLNTRKTHRIWIPSRLRYALSWILDPHQSVSLSGTPDMPERDPDDTATVTHQALSNDTAAKEALERLRVSRGDYRGPRKRSCFTRSLAASIAWLTNPAGMYALRMVIVTIATSIPAAIPQSAGFFYREKGIWGVISAQTCLLVYMADFTFSVICRGLGTVLGGVLGMVAWYIGSGAGPGNPYGLGAITAVMLFVLMWLRVFMSPRYAQATIMGGVTFILVVGFSYDSHHIKQYGLPGIGYEAFWKRLVTVLLGFLASCIVQLFPKPPSATSHVCKTLANTIGTLADHYALVLSHWGSSNNTNTNLNTTTTNEANPEEEVPPPATQTMTQTSSSPLSAVAEQLSLDVAETLVALDSSLSVLNIEATLRPFDPSSLREIQKLCLAVNQSLGRLLALSSTLPRDLQDRFSVTVGFLDDHVIGDVMAVLGVVALSIKTGAAMPERLPAPLARNFYTWWHAQHRRAMLSKELVRHDSYRRYCVAVSAYLRLLSAVDDLVLVVKGAVGERHVVRQWADA